MRIWLAFIFGVALVAGAPGTRAEFDIDKVEKSVVRVYVEKTKDGRTFRITGSGFVINADGYVVTNNHVIEGSIWVKIPDGSWSNLRSAEIVWQNKFVDLAVIKVRDFKRPHVPLAVPEPKRGAQIWAVGFPGPGDSMERRVGGKRSLQATVTAGVVGKLFLGSHNSDPRSARRIIQHSAETNPGNSGGPLFNACHQVVGIHTYGKRTILRIATNPQTGKRVAVGRTSRGIGNGSHVSVLIKYLKAKQIAFTPATAVCRLTSDSASGIPIEIYLYIAAASVLGAVGVALALRRPRERIVKVVETYSDMLRRKRQDVVRGQQPAPPRAQRNHGVSPPPPPGDATASGWLFTGHDRNGRSVRFLITERDLERAQDGIVIGRKAALVDQLVTDRSVSRRHARIVALGEDIGIVDLNSTHGTKIDGRKIEPFADPKPMRSGAQFTLGGVTLKVSRQ